MVSQALFRFQPLVSGPEVSRFRRRDVPSEGVGERRICGRMGLRLHVVHARRHPACQRRRERHCRPLRYDDAWDALVSRRRNLPKRPPRYAQGRRSGAWHCVCSCDGADKGEGERRRYVGHRRRRHRRKALDNRESAPLGCRRPVSLRGGNRRRKRALWSAYRQMDCG